MIEVKSVTKCFESIKAVDDVTVDIKEGNVFGLIGTNGAGKSTVLRMIAGVLKADSGEVLLDGLPVFDNIEAKKRMFFIADDPYFFKNATPSDMEQYFRSVYENFAVENFYAYLEKFELEKNRKINTFSKGMKKQLALLCGICSNTKYLFCDETFDGLDPVMRQGIKSIFAGEMESRGMTPIIASHNLRELEDICDYVGLLHRGGILLSKDLEDMKCNIQKIQCIFEKEEEAEGMEQLLSVVKKEKRGSLCTYTVRGNREEVRGIFESAKLLFFEMLPLTLEEIFISETEVVGYDIKKLILD